MSTNVFNEAQAAKYLGLAPKTLQMRRFKCLPPAYLKLGGAVRYRRDDLDAYIESCRIDPEKRGQDNA